MYIPKDYKMVCDRCGGVYRKSKMREEWTGLWVCTRGCWEPRHPQDFVEGVEDFQSVPVARPDVANAMGSSTLSLNVNANANYVVYYTNGAVSEDDPIGIVQDNGIVFWTFIDEIAHGFDFLGVAIDLVYLGSRIHGAAAAGNVVYLPSLDNETWT